MSTEALLLCKNRCFFAILVIFVYTELLYLVKNMTRFLFTEDLDAEGDEGKDKDDAEGLLCASYLKL